MPPPPKPPQKEYVIGGVKVLFPVKPYPSQMAMMAQIVKGLHRRQNCLLESPTGSGKSLALLCSTLAWHQSEKDKAQRYNDLIFQGVTDPDILNRAAGLTNAPPGQTNPSGNSGTPGFNQTGIPASPGPSQDSFNVTASAPPPLQSTAEAAEAAATGGGFIPEGDDDDDDFRPQNRQFRNPIGNEMPPLGGEMDMSMNEALEDLTFNMGNNENQQDRRPPLMKVPKIYFGTRTHKQIYQIMKELRRTAYKHVKTTVLSSREHTCVHPSVSKMRNKNEGCQQLNDPREGVGNGCRYKHGVNRIKNHDKLSDFGIQPAWDIEDLVTLGKKVIACPYFTARALKETADVIFCPYNYLVDPIIRDSMSIDLRDQIIVLDEAHNIEDSARESTSCSIKQDDLFDAIEELRKMVRLEFCIPECTVLGQMLSTLTDWIDLHKDKLTDYKEFDRSGKIYTGTEMVVHLENLKIGYDRFEELKGCLATISADQDPDDDSPRVKTPTLMLLKAIFLMFQFLFMEDMKYRDDYRIALVKSQVRNPNKKSSDGFFSRRGSVDWEYSMNFWCLNPGVAFLSVGSDARSIILSSGTLSPMSSFQSELAVPFKIQLEANHVIDKSQVWVGTVSRGPTEQALQATYRNTETWEFQDELGRLVLDVCKVIPHGVLCFFPSYSMLNKLLDRWQCTGLWSEISKIKLPMTEPRKGEEFEMAMNLFYDTIRDTKNVQPGEGINGVFFMAVCRGKVSEGLDFTDDNARAVISVGIPFPSIKDIQVDLKRQYNNQHFKTRGLLPGTDWYEIQAYRALNQALGRCIRHRYDWGALILVDERYQRGSLSSATQQTKYTKGLSKWVRNKVVHHRYFSQALSDLKTFSDNMVANPPMRPESLDETLTVESQADTTQKESQCDNKHFTNSDLKLVDPNIKSLTPCVSASTSDRSSNAQETPPTFACPSQIDKRSCKLEGFDTSIIAGPSKKCYDPDFLSDDEVVLPPSRVSITSTQVYDLSKSSIKIPDSLSQIPIVENTQSETIQMPSTQYQSSQMDLNSQLPSIEIAPHTDMVNSYFEKPKETKIKSLVKKHQSSKKRKSFSLDVNGTDNTRDLSSYFSKVNKDLQSISGDSETESNIPHDGNQSKRRLLDVCENGVDKKENQESGQQDSASEVGLNRRNSPQLFDSDEDLFSDYSPSKRTRKSSSGTPKKDQTPSKVGHSANCENVAESSKSPRSPVKDENTNFDKENKCSKIKAKNSVSIQDFEEVPNKSYCDDSDMEDFCLEKSYTTPKVKKMRRLSKSKPNIEDL